MLMLVGLTLALVLALGTMKAVEWLRRERKLNLSSRMALLVGTGAGLVFFVVGILAAKGSFDIVLGVAVGVGVGVYRGFGGGQGPAPR